MIKITVNYKAGSTTSPPVTPPELIYIGSWPTTTITITEGDTAPPLISSGAGNYTFQWYKTIDGVFTPIPGATSFYYYPGTPLVTTTYFRKNILGSNIGNSNEITITVIKAPPILNNTIAFNLTQLNGVLIEGSLPTGGGGANSYIYTWYIIDEDGDSSELPDTSFSYILHSPEFDRYFNSSKNFEIIRNIQSAGKYSRSNALEIPHISDIQNNIISINNKQVTGGIPTGGIGIYKYSWSIYYTGDAIDFDETTKDLDLTPYQELINRISQIDNSARLIRKVSSGKTSISNGLSINGITSRSLQQENTLTSTVYPNPSSGSVNFTTNFSSNKEMEIIIYSEKSKKTQTVFKGITTPNQIVKWDIPSNYPKGIYYYKIVSDNKQVKSGKILYQ
ncbi:T9SS type A sorting domain-containing protein [Flavobacterium aestivum]|uniref:T9SS type A sorting domain-containing protein n=1 Tax=Flavobacterium aestivum TaxID=3003257 RepID=UPI002482E582|nr:T9SS type A sorting domain-containing protein [Flavobacterium aestivum]